jgi:hypothetical protein
MLSRPTDEWTIDKCGEDVTSAIHNIIEVATPKGGERGGLRPLSINIQAEISNTQWKITRGFSVKFSNLIAKQRPMERYA